MKRLREVDSYENESKIIITGFCSGLYLQECNETKDVLCLIFTIIKNLKSVQKETFSLILDENSILLLSPFLLHTIEIKKAFKSEWKTVGLSNNYYCYKISSIVRGGTVDRLIHENKLLTSKKIRKILYQNYFLYTLNINNGDINSRISDKQQQIIKSIFNNYNTIPLYDYNKSIKILTLITTLMVLTNEKFNDNNTLKRKKLSQDDVDIDEDDKENENKNQLKILPCNKIWEGIFNNENKDSQQFLNEKLFDKIISQKTQLEQLRPKQFKDKNDFIKSLNSWNNNLKHVFYYRYNTFGNERDIRFLFSIKGKDKLLKSNNQNINLSFITDFNIEKLYEIFKLLLNNYYNNLIIQSSIKKEYLEKYYKEEQGKKYIEKIDYCLFFKDKIPFNIVLPSINLLRTLFFKNYNEEEIEELDDSFIINDFIIFLIESIINFSKSKLKTRFMTMVTLNMNDLIYLISKIFPFNIDQFKGLDNNDYLNKINELIIIGEYNSNNNKIKIKKISLRDLIDKLFLKLSFNSNHFRINQKFKDFFNSVDNNNRQHLKYLDLLCFINIDDDNFKYENNNNTILNHSKIFLSSYLFNLLEYEKFTNHNLYNDKTIFNFIIVSRSQISSNNDLLLFQDIIQNNIENFTLIFQTSKFSFNRSNKFIESFKKSIDNSFSISLFNDLELLDLELFNPDDDYNTITTTNENEININSNNTIEELKEIKDLSLIKENRLKNLFIIDCHLMGCKEWYSLFAWIIKNMKKIQNIYFIGCPFLLPPKYLYGQPFIDALFQISEIEARSIIFNKNNINNNFHKKGIQNEDSDELIDQNNLIFKLKNSFTQTMKEFQ